MPTFKITIRKGIIRANGTANLKIRVCHKGKVRYISTDYYVLPKYFDNKAGIIKPGGQYSKDEANKINGKLLIKMGVMADKSEKQKNIEYMDVISLMMILRDKHREFDFFALIDERIETLRKLGNINYR